MRGPRFTAVETGSSHRAVETHEGIHLTHLPVTREGDTSTRLDHRTETPGAIPAGFTDILHPGARNEVRRCVTGLHCCNNPELMETVKIFGGKTFDVHDPVSCIARAIYALGSLDRVEGEPYPPVAGGVGVHLVAETVELDEELSELGGVHAWEPSHTRLVCVVFEHCRGVGFDDVIGVQFDGAEGEAVVLWGFTNGFRDARTEVVIGSDRVINCGNRAGGEFALPVGPLKEVKLSE